MPARGQQPRPGPAEVFVHVGPLAQQRRDASPVCCDDLDFVMAHRQIAKVHLCLKARYAIVREVRVDASDVFAADAKRGRQALAAVYHEFDAGNAVAA